MTITVPAAVTAPALPLPDPADRATFTARKLEYLRWEKEDLAPDALALAICHCWRAPMIARMAKAEKMAAEQKRAYQARLKSVRAAGGVR